MTRLTPHFTRRELLRTAAVGAVTLPLLGSTLCAAEAAKSGGEMTSTDGREHGLRLGIATYSTRDMSLEDSIATIKALRIVNAGVFRKHCDWEGASLDEVRAVAAKFKAAGIAITGSGVVNFTTDEAKCRKAFENAQAAGMATIVCKPVKEALPLVERLAKEYDQRLAIHNHGPEDKIWPSPYDAFDAIKSLDSRLGLCLDVGHTMRAKVDPAAAVKQCASRIYDVHLKDSRALPGAVADIPVEVGAGQMNIRSILQALRGIKYNGVVAFEYEKVGGNPVIGLTESVGYVRGMLAAMG